MKDILPGIALAAIMGCCVYPIQFVWLPDIVTLLVQFVLGAGIYIEVRRCLGWRVFNIYMDLSSLELSVFARGKESIDCI